MPACAVIFLAPGEAAATAAAAGVRWAFLVDTEKCVGCGLCVDACKQENEIPYDAPVSRTWVERYVVTKDGETHADSPDAGLHGFTSPAIRGEEIPAEDIEKAFFVPKLCNQCDNPPCVQVCPVGATYQTEDGVVLVDRKWCIGCGYCIMACPYGVRFFHPVTKTAEKCNFCDHRITQDLKPACVQACPFEARQIANLKNPEDPVTQVIMTERVQVLKDEYGTKPQVFYRGLDEKGR
jgi:Fe-S-cluster-containing dehydrogenase component